MTNILTSSGAETFKIRISKLTPESKALWGKMTVSQMLAHCNVSYEMTFEDIHPEPGTLKTFFLKTFLKSIVVGPKPYKKNSATAPEFKMTKPKDFEKEKNRLLTYINQTVALGEIHFEGRKSHSFGQMTSAEYNMMFAKHLDHHLSQFGV